MLNKFREPGSGLSHLAGAVLSAVALGVMLYVSIRRGNAREIISFAVFGVSLVLLYTSSAVYHLVNASQRVVARLRTLDHSMIYVLIAGTYTPICLMALEGKVGYVLLAIAWSLAIAGIIVRILAPNMPRLLYTSIYVVIGSLALSAVGPLLKVVSARGVSWLLAGGVSYVIGAVIYAVKKPNIVPRWLGFHEIFHVFVLLGSASHFIFVIKYC